MTLRISVPFNVRAEEHQSVKALARRFSPVNDFVTAVWLTCTVCKRRDKANSRIVGKGKRPPFVCGNCRKAGG